MTPYLEAYILDFRNSLSDAPDEERFLAKARAAYARTEAISTEETTRIVYSLVMAMLDFLHPDWENDPEGDDATVYRAISCATQYSTAHPLPDVDSFHLPGFIPSQTRACIESHVGDLIWRGQELGPGIMFAPA